MLDQSLKDQISSLFASLHSDYLIRIQVSSTHTSRQELVDLLQDVSACSPNVSCVEEVGDQLQFTIEKDGVAASYIFKAVPNGHEFTSLLLAILNMEGIGRNLPDDAITARIKALKGKINLKSYISLTCTNCPDIVQSLNVLSILNPSITHEIIDGEIHQEEVNELNIQAVPTVYADGELLHVGRSSLGELLSKLEEKYGFDEIPVTGEIKSFDVIVAGGGPAGVAAAIYSARKGFNVAIVAEHIGGQVTETVGIENMVSIPKTTGKELSADMLKHLNDYPVEVLTNRKITEVKLIDGHKHVITALGETLVAPALILATGASWRRLNVPGESQYIGSGVAFCTHCDGPFYKDKKVAVIGGGNSGLEAAIDLSGIASEVTVLEYLDELKGDQILQDKLKSLPNVKIITGAETLAVKGDGAKVNGLDFKYRSDGISSSVDLDGVFVQIGLKPNSDIFRDFVAVNRYGEIEIDQHCRTNIPGVYAAGDVTTVPYKQIIIAMGEGSKAALSAFEDKIKGKQTV